VLGHKLLIVIPKTSGATRKQYMDIIEQRFSTGGARSPWGRLTIYWGSVGTFGNLQTKLSTYELI